LYDTWNKNPKFILTIQEKGVYRVALSRPGKRWTRNMPLDHMLGIYVLRSENASGAVAIEKKLTVRYVVVTLPATVRYIYVTVRYILVTPPGTVRYIYVTPPGTLLYVNATCALN
jgi:hypothetical protein